MPETTYSRTCWVRAGTLIQIHALRDIRSHGSDVDLSYLCRRWKGSTVAIKVIKHQRHGYASNENVSREMMIGVASIHPNIVAVYDVFTERMQKHAFSDQSTAAFNLQTFMVMELCDRGSLFKRRCSLLPT